MLRLTIIVAATKSNGIGKNAGLPWRLSKEMKYFAQVTTSAPEGRVNAVVMGKNTWESIPTKYRPLSRRVNIVASRNKDYILEASSTNTPAHLHVSLASALEHLNSSDVGGAKPLHRAFIIGGATLYSETLTLPASSSAFVDRILLTRIISPDFDDCDVFMPDFLQEDAEGKWDKASHGELEEWVGFKVPQGVQEENGVKYEFQMWTRN
ncbi:hypothetical protein DXG03_006999 [Asterophora parasitica]|uniref:Dihydrofolate reductase n=1 Tax=Asterophora parasitica TaxID=117018 RepID=A0A9P7GIL1_9AGAR|nr:hypothetical protein DXG03_006999 [Asterophora parasitica]